MKYLASLLTALLLITSPAMSQDSDRGYIAGLLEDSLAGEGRTVRINGFSGALRRRASVSSIVISDDDGEWLRMENLGLQLNRSALLRGRVEIEELSAERINLIRLPVTPESDLPPAAAQGFSLPELPVSIDIKQLKADEIILGEPILGEAAALELSASLSLIGGQALAELVANRTDSKRGIFEIDIGFSDDGQEIDLNVRLDEGEGGVAARLLGLPGNPSVNLTITGSGTLNDLDTDISIATDGQDRLTGTVSLIANAPAAEGATVSRSFEADISGDVTALFAPQYRPFFGDQVSLNVTGQRGAEGAVDISSLDLKTDALALAGNVTLNRDYWPTDLNLTGRIGNDAPTLVTLPISGPTTALREALLEVQFDQEKGNAWTGIFEVTDLKRDGLKIANTTLNAEGTLDGKVNAIGSVLAYIDMSIKGLSLDDPDLMRAVGSELAGQLQVSFIEDQPLKLSDMKINGSDFTLSGNAEISELASGFDTMFDTQLDASNISRFSGLAGNELAGSVTMGLRGTANLGGEFDIALSGDATDIKVGQELADKLLRGQIDLTLEANRNSVGTRIENIAVRNSQIAFDGSGLLTDTGADLTFETTLNDTSQLAQSLKGSTTIAGTAKQRDGEWSVDVEASGPYQSNAKVDGVVTGPNALARFKTTLPDINPLVPQYRGALSVEGTAENSLNGWMIQTTLDGPYGLTAGVEGRVTGDSAPDVSFVANVPDVGPVVPKVSGPLNLSGDLRQISDVLWAINANLDGLSGTSARVAGSVSTNGQLDVSVVGQGPLALANPFLTPRSVAGSSQFDLRIKGPPELSSVNGTIRTSDASIVSPNLQIALQDISASVALASERATVDVTGQVSSGGTLRISGPVGLSGTMPANLRVSLDGVILEDPTLYRTQLDGALGIDGSLLSNARISGRIDVGETQISVPSSGISSFGTIPTITHINTPSDVQRTRVKAGLVTQERAKSGGSNGGFPLDITISAPRQIFVRGRGLDAELGGNLRLTGTTANIVSSGRFELQRGRLDILSKRFDLDEGIIQLQGDFDPFLRFVAITNTSVGTASVIVEGSASDPEVRFESSPESPQDEVLAQIFFGRDVSQISALQALQLASAVATLAGRGGEGVVSKLRRSFDLDDLDITTDEEGNAGLRAGKYISENVYTDVTVGTQNNAEVSLNIDLTPTITATGKLGSNGDTSLGIYFLKDY